MMDKDHMTERILNLTLEIIYLLTREIYTVVKTSGESLTSNSRNHIPEGLKRAESPITEPPPSSLIHERNDLKILELTTKIIQLLTGEVPIRCQDVTVYFSKEEWEYVEGHQDRYKDIMMEKQQPLSSSDMSSFKSTSAPPNLSTSPPDSICQDESLMEFQTKVNNHVKRVAQELTSCEEHLQITDISTSTKCTQTEAVHTAEASTSVDDDGGITLTAKDATMMKYSSDTSKSFGEGNTLHILPGQIHNESTPPGNETESCEKGNNIYTPAAHKPDDITDQSNSWKKNLKNPKSYTPTHNTETKYASACIVEVSTLCDKGNGAHTDIYTPVDHREIPDTTSGAEEIPSSWEKNVMYTNIYTPTELTQIDLTHIKKELVAWEDSNHPLDNMCLPSKTMQKKIAPSSGRDRSLTNRDNYPQAAFTTSHIKTEWEEVNVTDLYIAPEQTQTAYDTDNKDGSSYDENFNSTLAYASPQIMQMYNCPLCKKCFSSSSNLAKHGLICKGWKPHVCSRCGKCFASASYLVIHERIHTGEKPYSCSHCGKSFTRKPDLIRHERIHTGEKPFACPECGKCFTSVSNIFMHRRIHSGEKPFPCTECGKRFIKKSDLVRHEKIHLPQKPLPCPECGQFFGSRAILNKHMLSHAGNTQVIYQGGS